MTTSTAQAERAALVETMRAAGPDAPTLCGDWTTRDLAAHLVVRERRLDAAPGILISPLADYTQRVQEQVTAETGYDELLDKVASGPPLFSPFKLLDRVVNVAEMFIHNEDVRRAAPGWTVRDVDDATQKALSRPLIVMARMSLSGSPARVSLRTGDGKTLATVGRGPAVTVIGDPGELLLYVSGRDETQLTFCGADADIAAAAKSRTGL